MRRISLYLLLLTLMFWPATHAVAAPKSVPEIVIYEWYCIGKTCDLGIDIFINGPVFNEDNGIQWRYRLEGGKWSDWTPYVYDYARIFQPWVPNMEVTGEVQIRYHNTEVGSGALKLEFSRIMDQKN